MVEKDVFQGSREGPGSFSLPLSDAVLSDYVLFYRQALLPQSQTDRGYVPGSRVVRRGSVEGKRGMEEQQIQEFVHRALLDQARRQELAHDPAGVVAREGFSPRVARVILRLVPHLALDAPLDSAGRWWHV